MSIHFAFSDECGDYQRMRTSKFLKAHPFYVRATLHFSAEAWRQLEVTTSNLKERFGLPLDREIKWSFLWSLDKHRINNETVPKSRDYCFLKDVPSETLQAFVRTCVENVSQLPEVRVLFTITDNKTCARHTAENIYKWHLQETLQRVQMDMEAGEHNTCVLFCDPMSQEKDKLFRNAYADLYRSGDKYKSYDRIKDSLNLEHSHHSVGIQCVDYLAGAFTSMLRGYPFGEQLYREVISHIIRRGNNGEILGYGARLVPRGKDYESILARVL
jgi:hypothetical protein